MARWARALMFVGGLAAGACGPISYVSTVTTGAASSVDAARAAEAETYAPYFWTRATQYLVMAREEAARADFQGAVHFGKLSQAAADTAVTEAIAAKADPSKRPLTVAPTGGKAPAKDAEPTPVAPAKDAP